MGRTNPLKVEPPGITVRRGDEHGRGADRVGLDHLSFSVASRDDLDQAARLFDEHDVTHGEIASLPAFGIDVLSFEDPDGVQLELTAPMAPAAAGG